MRIVRLRGKAGFFGFGGMVALAAMPTFVSWSSVALDGTKFDPSSNEIEDSILAETNRLANPLHQE